MKLFVKSMAVVGLIATAACTSGVEHNQGQSKLDPTIVAERMTIRDGEGVTTWDILQQNGVTVAAEKTNEGSTFGQDMALTIAGAATGPLINAAAAHSLQDKKCKNGGCGGAGAVVQVVTDVDTNVSAPGGCGTLCQRARN